MKAAWTWAAALLLLAAAGCGARRAAPEVIVLGIDGMDPGFLEAHWAELPNLARLKSDGEFQRLATTMPPQSPVAWSTFITGAGPETHGIFDFVYRDPRTLRPFSSMGETEPGRWALPLGEWRLPLSSPLTKTFRRGRPFWKYLEDQGIPVTLVRMPMDYPPEKEQGGEALAGMGVPDLEGSYGTFSFYTDDPGAAAGDVAGGRIVPVKVEDGRVVLRIFGPANPFRRDGAKSSVAVTVDVDTATPSARFVVGGEPLILRQGEWSAWVKADFPLLPHVKSARGMFRIYAKRLAQGFQVYVSPVNIDPGEPAVAISAPARYSEDLAERAGPFYTQGMPQDTAALRQHVFDRGEYLAQSREVSREQLRVMEQALDEFHGGFFFCHFYGVDQDSHMLWRKYQGELLGTYRMVDEAVGRVRAEHPRATLLVMSDHGFAAFDRAANLNTWLLGHGYLRLRRPLSDEAHALESNVDWSGTEAYAMGLNSLYLNLAGREAHGIVQPRDAAATVARIAKDLREWRDPDHPEAAVVASTWAPYGGGAGDRLAPDLVVGFARGYRASWDGALGGLGLAPVEDNRDEWIGDHCMDAAAVPGVLLANKKSRLNDPALRDLAASILGLYSLAAVPPMDGRRMY